MDGIVCDACGATLLIDADVRYVLEIEGYAAWDPLEVTSEDLRSDHGAEIERLVEELRDVDPEEAQDEVHRRFRYDLCPACWRRLLRDPLAGLRQDPRDGGKNEKSQGD